MKKYLFSATILLITSNIFGQDSEADVILKGLTIRNFSPIHSEEFNWRSQKYFSLKGKDFNAEKLTVGRESFTLYHQQGFIVPSTGSIYTNPNSTEERYTKEEVIDQFKDTTNWLTNRIVAYNKILFNDDPDASTYFLENLDDANEVVIDFGYDNNEFITKYVVKNIDLEQLEHPDFINLLFYKDDRTFRQKVADVILKKRSVDFIEQLTLRLVDVWDQLGPNKADAITYFLRNLTQIQDANQQSERLDYAILERLASKDLKCIFSMERNRFANGSIYKLIDEFKENNQSN